MKILSIAMILMGIGCFVYYKRFVKSISISYTAEFKKNFGDSRNWESPKYQIVYKTVVIIAGILLIIIGIGTFIG